MKQFLTDCVELGYEHTCHGAKEAKNVAPPRIVVGCVALGKEPHTRIDAVFSNSLQKGLLKFSLDST